MIKTPFKLKYKNLEGVVDELANASKMHKKQSEVIEDHIADMEGESPAKLIKTPGGPVADKKEVKEDDNVPLSPGYEDPVKIQKVQREGLTPGSQGFVEKVKENVKSKNYVESSDLEKHDDDR